MSGWQAGQAVTWVRHVFLGVQGGRLLVRGFAGVGVYVMVGGRPNVHGWKIPRWASRMMRRVSRRARLHR